MGRPRRCAWSYGLLLSGWLRCGLRGWCCCNLRCALSARLRGGITLFSLLGLLASSNLDAADLDETKRVVLTNFEALFLGQLCDALGAGQHVAVLVKGAGLGL